ncbi:MAG: DUF2203 domain-containing protein [Polyangiales bacterium]
MATQRVFTLEEASALLPELSALIAEQIARRGAIEDRLSSLAHKNLLSPEGIVEHPDDPPEVRAVKGELIMRLHEYQEGWNRVENLGAVVKDARVGLLDFYCRIDGKLVFLCWRYGEETIGHYHTIDSGVAGRKPLETALKTRLYN